MTFISGYLYSSSLSLLKTTPPYTLACDEPSQALFLSTYLFPKNPNIFFEAYL